MPFEGKRAAIAHSQLNHPRTESATLPDKAAIGHLNTHPPQTSLLIHQRQATNGQRRVYAML